MAEIATSVERLQDLGVRAASITDLMAVGFARRKEDAAGGEPSARELFSKLGSLRALAELTSVHLKSSFGLEGFENLKCLALIELGRRVGGAGKGEAVQVSSAQDVADMFGHLRDERKEHFVAVFFDAKMSVLRSATIHIGTLTMSVVGPREVFREAIREGASSIIVAHNHPSGDPTPSAEDVDVTDRLVEIGKMLDIPVLDHVIIGERSHVSLKERGLIG